MNKLLFNIKYLIFILGAREQETYFPHPYEKCSQKIGKSFDGIAF